MQTATSCASESTGPDSTVTTPTDQESSIPVDPLNVYQDISTKPNCLEIQANEAALQEDPSIHVDANNKEMKKVLEKASSTEVISALNLDSRLKSCSVSSLGSTRSDSYASVSSNISNGITEKAGSFTSVGSMHSASQQAHGSLVRYRSASGRPLSDIVSIMAAHYKSLSRVTRLKSNV